MLDRLLAQLSDARAGRWAESVLADLRFATRQLRRTPLATTTIVLVLALGVGINTALFTVLHSIFTMPPPGIARDDGLVRIRGLEHVRESGRTRARRLSYPEVRAYAEHRELFSDVVAWSDADAILDLDDPERGVLSGAAIYVTDNYFRVLGVGLVVGPGLPSSPQNESRARSLVGVIGYGLWTRHFGMRPDIVGRTLEVNGVPVTIVGVAPARFAGARADYRPELPVWLPLSARAQIERSGAAALASYDSAHMHVVARLQESVDVSRTMPTVRAIAARTAAATTRRPANELGADVVALLRGNERPDNSEATIAAASFGALGLLILMIACTTVSTLLVGVAVARRREIAVRLSLGAVRGRIVRQLLTESVFLSVAAGLLGLGVTWMLVRVFGVRVPEVELILQWPVAAFTFALAIATGIAFGMSPALHATRLGVSDVLKDTSAALSASRSWLQGGLVVAQIALSQPLLVGLGALLLVVVRDLRGQPESALHDHIISVTFDVYVGNVSREQRRDEIRRIRERLAATPGIVDAVPQDRGYFVGEMIVHQADRVAGVSEAGSFRFRTRYSPAGYFALMDIPFVRGRDFLESERVPAYASVVIGADLARKLWGTANPIGRRFLTVSRGEVDSSAIVVVGVVDEGRAGTSEMGNTVRVFVPSGFGGAGMLVRTRAPAQAMIPVIRSVAKAEAPTLPAPNARTLAAIEASQRTLMLQASGAAATGGILALLLSSIGLYAVVAFAIGQRTREIGVRTALGAQRRQVIGIFFIRGMRLSLLGLAIGLPLSLFALRVIAGQAGMPEVSTPALLAFITSAVIGVASLASWIPARRAASIDPLSALRTD